mgnify:CR=1 FL=1|jgi:hypothetical protein
MGEYFWFFLVAIGPVLFAAAVIYGLMRRRRLSSGEREKQHRKIKELYGDPRE